MATTKRIPRAPTLVVAVSQGQIDTAVQGDSGHCMIAEAVKLSVKSAGKPITEGTVSVDLQTIRYTDPERGLRYTYLTPRIAQVALVNFDQARKVEPFSFRMAGAQVTAAGWKRKKQSPGAKAASLKNLEKANKVREGLERPTLRGNDMADNNGKVPERVGGRTPPKAALAHPPVPFARRRAFGLRALER
jgi:hypothetical protein